MPTQYILSLNNTRRHQSIGVKAQSLRFLLEKGFTIPATLVCTWDAYAEYLTSAGALRDILASQLAEKLDTGRQYAVRSSANMEDGHDCSFAGQFKSVLNVHGIDSILTTVETIWASTHAAGVQEYLKKAAIDPGSLKMAVIIQEMVTPRISGVSFSKNPMTGMDEIIVEAVKGSGEALLQGGVTPQRWIYKWGKWLARPAADGIPLDLVQEVVNQTQAIAKAYGGPVDLEWVFDGHTIHWVQLREITSLKNVNVYSNYIAREVLPGIIKPLVWSINIPVVNSAWKKFFTELIGPIEIDATTLAKSFYYRTYFNMGTIGNMFAALGLPRETIELLMGIEQEGIDKPSFKPTIKTLLLVPNLLRFAADKMNFAQKLNAFLPVMWERYRAFDTCHMEQLSERELIGVIDRLCMLTEQTAYYNIVTQLMMGLYSLILKWQLTKAGIDFAQFDLTHGMEELNRFDPKTALIAMHTRYQELAEEVKECIKAGRIEEFYALPGIESLQHEFAFFVNHFGHLSDSGNDFSFVPWRENPEVILRMIADSRPPDAKAGSMHHFASLPVSPLWKRLIGPIYRRARAFRRYREEVSFLYTFGYGLFRIYFLSLGDRLVKRGILKERDAIFYLYFDEVKDLVEKHCLDNTCGAAIAVRKREIEDCRDITLPGIIYGDHPPPVLTHTVTVLKGTPTSRGYYQGKVKVIKGINDFAKLEDGNVLVIPYSDISWSPIFPKAGALISEAGGMLSHSSIIAREYNIPAVVSVSGACSLRDDTLVTVDGYRGEIVIHESAAA